MRTSLWKDPIPSRRALMTLLAALTPLLGSFSLVLAAAPSAGAANWAPVEASDFPDPSILHWGGEYYAFATQNFATASQTINIQVATSPNGTTWNVVPGDDALPNLPSWAEAGDTWAPSVTTYVVGTVTHFVMYYVATDADNDDQCIGVAVSSGGPLGPYVDSNSQPVECQTGLGGSIDPDVFTDNSGSSWLLWKSDGNSIGAPTDIFSVPLTGDPFTGELLPTGTTVQLLQNDPASWQGDDVEAPAMTETTTGSYYLFYAGNDWDSAGYAIGWAQCGGPGGPCTDVSAAAGPLLGTSPGVSGPGGPDVYTLPSGQLVMAFAGWEGSTIGYLGCGIRPMYLADLTFSGGTSGTPSLSPAVPTASPAVGASCGPPPPPPGYWQVGADGGVFTFGSAGFYGSTGSMHLNKPVVGMAATPDGKGYWLVASDGGVFAFGDAGFYGSTGGIVLNKPVVGMLSTLTGRGYWLIASDGGVFAFGDARFYGSAGGENLPYPVTAAALAFLGGGYSLVDANGQVYTYGDARYEGGPSFAPGGYVITGMGTTHDFQGYWLASANGNVADFGDATDYGDVYGTALNGSIVGMSVTRDSAGYWLQGSDGGIFAFGDAPYLGSMGGRPLNASMVGIASV
jgi:Glycosyl hydrolases family 43